MQLDVYLDLGNIAGYLAIDATNKLAADTGISISLSPIAGIVPRPLSREPKRVEDDPLADYKVLRWQAKRKFEMAELDRDCKRLALDNQLAERQVNADLTHLGLLYINQVDPRLALSYVTSVYERRFRDGTDLTTESEVNQVFVALGLDGADFFAALESWQKTMAEHTAAYLELGIHDSPSFVLNEETFQGRQHFPLMRWRIEGERGFAPL